ncbi:MAG: GntR family transcriptional regulator [Burkholderiales bacterium]|nr:GntR family transcriptional regulator [Burkholderiales bacterium]
MPLTNADDRVEASTRLEPKSASDIVFFGVVKALETQELVPGQRLVEADLVSQFQVGRNSVREALHRLSAEGLVDLLRNRGAAIRLLSLKETMDVLDVAERMTGLLARTAARGVVEQPAHRRMLPTALKELTQAFKEEDSDGFARGRRHFYRALLFLSGSAELKRLFPAIQMPIVYAQHRLPGLQKLRLRDYRLIAKAVSDGLEEEADEAGMAHVRNVREVVLQKTAKSS